MQEITGAIIGRAFREGSVRKVKLIAGLGNPGSEYATTKHNVGFMLVDALARQLGVENWKTKQDALVAETRIGREKVLLVKPLTYMNDSGRAIGPILAWYKLAPDDLVVIHDDMDLPVGMVRIRKKGSAGGHNGMKSSIYHVQEENFQRVRIGICRPPHVCSAIGLVLSPFWSKISHVFSPLCIFSFGQCLT